MKSLFEDGVGELGYKVLARKYRPNSFADLIGQEVLVQTLNNAIKMKRVPHAMLLTGIRGVGKTTTARIIAKILNCTHVELKGNVYVACARCDSCTSIAVGVHQDVLEMDAASHTGVHDVRSIIEGAHYRPVSGKYRVYIIDEAHMLSNSAFNALLKTLEEPPPHLIFILATTEIQKIPLTILSRCQRFDLRRISQAELKQYYTKILELEHVAAEDKALDLIASAADGSVRDGLSILDQVISLNNDDILKASLVRDILSIANKDQVVAIFMLLLAGAVAEVLDLVSVLYESGMDPVILLQQLLELVNEIIKAKVLQSQKVPDGLTETQYKQVVSVEIPDLARIWQMLLKGLEEVQCAPRAVQALEMLFIRICYVNLQMTPEEVLQGCVLQDAEHSVQPSSFSPVAARVDSVDDLLALLYAKNDLDMYYMLHNDVVIVKIKDGEIAINPLSHNANGLVSALTKKLKEHTGRDWVVSIIRQEQGQTLGAAKNDAIESKRQQLRESDLTQKILQSFTGSEIVDIVVR